MAAGSFCFGALTGPFLGYLRCLECHPNALTDILYSSPQSLISMKNIYSALLLIAPLAASAQLREARHQNDRPVHGHAKGISYYSETFDADLNGWSAETTVGVVDWKWTNVGPGPTSSTYPVPPLATSTPSGWAILDDDFDGVGGQSTDASLISPAIDLSAAPANLRVRFEQYFQEFQADATFVGVSVDGGSTWNEVEINAGVGREGRPNPEVIEVNISEWVSANPSNVQLRFRYTSTWDYGWQVDNVAIVEQFQYDMIAVSSFLSHNGTGEEYGRIPTSQLYPTMLLGGELKNDGSLDQTNVVASMTVRNGINEVAFSATSNIGNLAANTSAFMEEFASLPALGNDLYTATLEVTSDQAASDANPENNSRVRAFQVNDARYTLDGIGIHPGSTIIGSLGTNSFDGAEDGLILMTYYEVREPLDVNGMEFLITANTVLGGFVTVAIYDTTDVLAATPNFSNPVVESDAYDIMPDDISSGVVSVLFPQVATLPAGGYYAAVTLNSNGGVGTIRVLDDLTVPQPALASVIYIPADQVFTNGNATSVRLMTGSSPDQVATTEAPLGIALFPNPSNGNVTLRVAEAGLHRVEVIDAAGQLVGTSTVIGTSTLDLSDLAKGLYSVRVIGDKGIRVERITLN